MIDTSTDNRQLLSLLADFDASVADRALALGELIRRAEDRDTARRYSKRLEVYSRPGVCRDVDWTAISSVTAEGFASAHWDDSDEAVALVLHRIHRSELRIM